MPLRFALHYQGLLQSGQGAKSVGKHRLRRLFSTQIKKVWEGPRLSHGHADAIKNALSPAGKRGPSFVPLATLNNGRGVELDVLLMRRGVPGRILQHSDIDNRLKTLLDALKAPSKQAIPDYWRGRRSRCYCLAEDDSLVTKVTIESLEMLSPRFDQDTAVAIIRVAVYAQVATIENVDFA